MVDERPPLGLRPESVHTLLQVSEILQAIWRYAEVDKPVPVEWIDELQRRVCFERKEIE